MSDNILMFKSFPTVLTLAASLSLSFSAVHAQTKPDGQWRGQLGAGASASSGSGSSSAFNLAADIERATKADKIVFYGSMLYGKSKTAGGVKTTSADQLSLGGRYEWNFTDKIYAYGMGELGRNKVADLKMRSTIGAGVGYHLIQSPQATLDVFAGLGYTDSDFYTGSDAKGLELQIGEEGSFKLSETASLKQRVVLYPSLKDSRYTRATADLGLAVAMGNGWNLNTSLGAKFYNAPGAKTETLFLVGVSTRIGAK
jgi:putative salt-induced outer membrane protein